MLLITCSILLRVRDHWSYSHSVLLSCWFAYFSSRLGQLVISPVVPSIALAFDVSNSSLGLAFSAMWFAYALTQIPSGVLAEWVGERRTVLWALAGGAMSCLLLAFAPSFDLFVPLVGLLGASAGLYYNAAVSMITRNHEKIGSAIGIHSTGSTAAGLIAPLVGASLGVLLGWRWALLFGGVVAVVGFLAIRMNVRPRAPATRIDDRQRVSPRWVLTLLDRKAVVSTTVFITIGEFVGQAITSFLPVFLVAYQHFTLGEAGMLFTVFFAASGVAQPAMGWLSDRSTREAAVLISMMAGTIAFGVLVFSITRWVVLFAVGWEFRQVGHLHSSRVLSITFRPKSREWVSAPSERSTFSSERQEVSVPEYWLTSSGGGRHSSRSEAYLALRR